MNLWIYPVAFVAGLLFNINPACGSGTILWITTKSSRWQLIGVASLRVFVMALVGATAASLGTTIRKPWGILLLVIAAYLLYTTIKQAKAGQATCAIPVKSRRLPWLLAVIPPPSAFVGLVIFYGSFGAPSPLQGALTLVSVGLGLTLPVWLLAIFPERQGLLQQQLSISAKLHRTRLVFQLLGVAVLTAVGFAFLLVQQFHRPLVELVQ